MGRRTILLTVLLAILVPTAAAVGVLIYFRPVITQKVMEKADAATDPSYTAVEEEIRKDHGAAPARIKDITSPEDFGIEKWNEGPVRYDGKVYRYNTGLKNYLFMGIDNDNEAEPAADGIGGGQSDAMFLVCLDENRRKISVVVINRNTMVPVDVYDREGNYLVRMDLQICLQHGYGDGMKLSCMRSVEAVERLLHGIPVSGYLSLNMGGISAVNDAAGGVRLIPLETVKRGDVVLAKGREVLLNGEQAYAYLRTRDVDKFGSADERLERQTQYVATFIRKMLEEPSLGNGVYEAGKDYIVASMDLPRLINSASDMTFDDDSLYTVEGETVFRDDYEQYLVDEAGLIRLILKVFYEEAS